MNGIRILCVLLLLPALAALGHDAWRYYEEPEFGFQLSDVGYLLNEYAPDYLKILYDGTDPESWEQYVLPLLEQTTAIVAATPAILTYIALVVLWLFGLWPFADGVGPRLQNTISKKPKSNLMNNSEFGRKSKSIKYKRK